MAILSSPLQLLLSIPPVTRIFTAATIVSSLFYYWLHWKGDESTPYLTLVPGSSLFYPWTFFTSGFVETSVPELIVTLLVVPASLRYFERLWGSLEILKFILVCITVPNIIAFGFNWLEFMATRNADFFLYGMQYHGQMALQIAVLVAFTQIIPEHQVQILGIIRSRVKTLPMLYLTFSTIMTFISQCPYIIIQFGWFASWIYLRFYKKNTADILGGGDSYGDRSETFSLLSWFPPIVHYPLSILGNNVHAVATRFHLIPSPSSDAESSGYSQVPGGARAEAERRRAMALKALDQRLATSTVPSSSQVANGSPSQTPRPPPAAAASRSDAPAMPSSPASRTVEKQKSSDVGDIGLTRSESR